MEQARAWLDAFILTTLLPIGGKLLVGALILLIVWRLALLARGWFMRASARTPADLNLQLLLGRAIYLGILALGAVWALDVAGVSPTALVAALGVAGLAITLALQDVLKNFFAGVYLLFERPFRIGDEISLKDVRGRVVDVGVRTTSLRTEEGLLVLIPNAVVLAEIVTNRSA